jgi:sigma-B regulation protein RsbU (phosphoserine phosphatase)
VIETNARRKTGERKHPAASARLRYLLLLLLLCPALQGSAQSHNSKSPGDPAVFTLSPGVPIASLGGRWRFHPGDDPQFAQPDFDDSHWPLLASSKPWTAQGYKNMSGFGWYRFRVIVSATDEPVSILLPRIRTTYQCFIDGKLTASTGIFPPKNYRTFTPYPVIVPLTRDALLQAHTYVIALRVWETPLWAQYNGGGPIDAASSPLERVGNSQEIERFLTYYGQNQRQLYSARLDLAALDLLAGVISIALFFLRTSEREYLYFALAAFAETLANYASYLRYGHIRSDTLSDTVMFLLTFVSTLSLVFFFRRLLSGRFTWFAKVAIACLSLDGFALVLAYLGYIRFGTENLVAAASIIPFEIWVLILMTNRARKRVTDACLLLIPVSLVFSVRCLDDLSDAFRMLGHPFGIKITKALFLWPFPVHASELAKALFLLAMLAILINRFARTSRENERTCSEMEAARSLQRVLIPCVTPETPGLSISTAYYPAQEVGGDFFQIFPVYSGGTLIVLGDVSGKGIKAAMTVSMIVGTVRALKNFTESPGEILSGLNECLLGRDAGFTTCIALNISRTGLLRMANGGQISPYHNGVELMTAPSLPLGLDRDAIFAETTQQLRIGDRLTLLTDGVPEATFHRELFGFDRTQAISMEDATAIAEMARAFGQTDDITVLSVSVLAREGWPGTNAWKHAMSELAQAECAESVGISLVRSDAYVI